MYPRRRGGHENINYYYYSIANCLVQDLDLDYFIRVDIEV